MGFCVFSGFGNKLKGHEEAEQEVFYSPRVFAAKVLKAMVFHPKETASPSDMCMFLSVSPEA